MHRTTINILHLAFLCQTMGNLSSSAIFGVALPCRSITKGHQVVNSVEMTSQKGHLPTPQMTFADIMAAFDIVGSRWNLSKIYVT